MTQSISTFSLVEIYRYRKTLLKNKRIHGQQCGDWRGGRMGEGGKGLVEGAF